MDIRKVEKRILNGFYVFMGLVVLIYLSGGMSYVPLENLERLFFPIFSIIIFTLIIGFMASYDGTKSQPAGFKKVGILIREKRIKDVLKLVVYLPISSAIMGYFVYAVVATVPALPTKLLTYQTETKYAQCIKTGRDKVRGHWSIFKLPDGEEWKVAGYGKVCASSERSCKLTYSKGFLGYYIRGVRCS